VLAVKFLPNQEMSAPSAVYIPKTYRSKPGHPPTKKSTA